MKTLEIGCGDVIIATDNTNLIATVSPISTGFWVSIGHPSDRGVLVDHDEWKAFVELVDAVDSYVEKNHQQAFEDKQ
jgi:Ser-tRNA(Ala) deacylase AlaX